MSAIPPPRRLLLCLAVVFAAQLPALAQAGGRINVNAATAKELRSLPGIGKVTAERIIEERERGGAFVTVEDLRRVKGIGKGRLEKIRALVTVGSGAIPEAAPSTNAASADAVPAKATAPAPAPDPNRPKVNLNTADAKQLRTLSGIGKRKAERIVLYREAYGAFATVDAITKVPGIGKGTLARIRDELEVHVDLNRASLAELERLFPESPQTAKAIVAEREKKGAFAGPGDLQKVSGIDAKVIAPVAELLFAAPLE